MAEQELRLFDYARGILTQPERNELEAALSREPGLRAQLREIVHILEGLDDAHPVSAPAPRSRRRLLDAVGRSALRFADRVAELFDLSAEAANEVLRHLDDVPGSHWTRTDDAGFLLLHFDGGQRVASDMDCGIVYMEPGSTFPLHRHGSDEWALMLQGEIVEDSGTRFQPGDIVLREAGSQHSFRAADDGPAAFAVMTRIESLEFQPG